MKVGDGVMYLLDCDNALLGDDRVTDDL